LKTADYRAAEADTGHISDTSNCKQWQKHILECCKPLAAPSLFLALWSSVSIAGRVSTALGAAVFFGGGGASVTGTLDFLTIGSTQYNDIYIKHGILGNTSTSDRAIVSVKNRGLLMTWPIKHVDYTSHHCSIVTLLKFARTLRDFHYLC